MNKGYNPEFLSSKPLSLPVITKQSDKKNIIPLLDYTHFSILMNKLRRLPFYTAVNIKGDKYKQSTRKEDPWSYDKRLANDLQIGNSFYDKTNKKFDRGHLVRRLDPCWGLKKERMKAERDTFHFTNSSPQYFTFNRNIWYELEKQVLENGAEKGNTDICVFAGPVLKNSDRVYHKLIDGKEIQIPLYFWKVIVWKKSDKKLYAVGFIQSQASYVKKLLREKGSVVKRAITKWDEDFFENLEFKNDKVYQVHLKFIERQTGLKFKWSNVKQPFNKKKAHSIDFSKSKGKAGFRKSLNIIL